MSIRNGILGALVVGCATLAAPVQASPITWNFQNGNLCTAAVPGASCTGAGIGITNQGVRAGSGTTAPVAGTSFQTGTLTNQGGSGLGFTANGEPSGSPNHAIDNSGPVEFVLMRFTSAVNLTGLSIGWVGSDADFMVLAYTGAIGSNTAPNALTSVTSQTYGSLLGSGWSVVATQNNSSTGAKTFANSVVSSWWMVGTLAALPGAGLTNVDAGADYFKLQSVTGRTVPEPATLALLGLGLVGAGLARRRRAA